MPDAKGARTYQKHLDAAGAALGRSARAVDGGDHGMASAVAAIGQLHALIAIAQAHPPLIVRTVLAADMEPGRPIPIPHRQGAQKGRTRRKNTGREGTK